jgi:hypothetical protein
MGTLFDINKSSTHDYVDNPYWSVFQIRVKHLMHQQYIQHHFNFLKKYDQERYRNKEEQLWKDQEDKSEVP